MPRPILIFDMDGVLVDVSDSYRETIQQTVQHFTAGRPSREEIQDWKNRGGWNDDWALANAMIRDRGVKVEYDAVVDCFQRIFHGDGSTGLILRERWIARGGLFERLSTQYQLAVFTGRLRWEAELTLRRFTRVSFHPIVGAGDVPNHKPAPDGLLHIARLHPGSPLWYIGDTIDDARSAAAAKVPFIGIASPDSPRRDDLVRLLREQGATAVLEDINHLESVLPQ